MKNISVVNSGSSLASRLARHKILLFMFLPGFLLILLFSYGPMYGIQIAFKDYSLGLGVWGSDWVGMKHFQRLFTDAKSLSVIWNTIAISLLKLGFGFPAPILLALILNEADNRIFKKTAQTVSYLPHFLSWIIVANLFTNLLSPGSGVVNHLIKLLGGQPVYFLTDPAMFRATLVFSSVWKEVGWGTVVYMAVIASIDVSMYEAAIADGANRLQRMIHLTLPSLIPTASILLILSVGGIMNAGFDQVFNMYNPLVLESTDIIDTYVYRVGLVNFSYSFSAAVGLFKSLVGLIMVLIVNSVTGRLSGKENGLW